MESGIEELERKIDVLIRLVAIRCVDGKGKNDAIRLLGRVGVSREEIARVCDTTPNTVSIRLSEAKKKRKSNNRETTYE